MSCVMMNAMRKLRQISFHSHWINWALPKYEMYVWDPGAGQWTKYFESFAWLDSGVNALTTAVLGSSNFFP